MSSTRPGIAVFELFSGDGPHLDLADRFVEGRCAACGGAAPRDRRDTGERWRCLLCSSVQEGVGE